MGLQFAGTAGYCGGFLLQKRTHMALDFEPALAPDLASNGDNNEPLHVCPGAELYLFFRQA